MYVLYPELAGFIVFFSALIGVCFGSFLNCLAWRTVHGESIMKGRSHCDSCGHVLGLADLIPVVSYLIHKGRCRWCGSKLPSLYLWSELISAAVFVSIALKFGISPLTLQYLLFASVLLACTFADLEAYIIPDGFIISAIVIRLIFIFTSGSILSELKFSAIGGFSVSLALLLIVSVFEKIIKREAMGGGDIKLFFVTGLYLGWRNNILCLFLSCILGIVFALITQKSRTNNEDAKAFPFGPSIAAAAWLCLLTGDSIINAYLSLF